MLLNELKTNEETRIKKINRALRESCGFSLNENVDLDKLRSLHSRVSADLQRLKENQVTAKDRVYAEKLLVQEGLNLLINKLTEEHVMAPVAGPGGRALGKVVQWLADYVRKACEIGDDYDEAIYEAMKHYRSSPYRFEDELVEYELRKETNDCAPLEEDKLSYDEFTKGSRLREPEDPNFEPAECPYCKFETGEADPDCPHCDGKGEVFEGSSSNRNHKDFRKFVSLIKRYNEASSKEHKSHMSGNDRLNAIWDKKLTEINREFLKHFGHLIPKKDKREFNLGHYDTDEPVAMAKAMLGEKIDEGLNEEAPPGMEDWIKDRKEDFKDQYGDDWEEVLYATAWDRYNKKNEGLEEAGQKKRPRKESSQPQTIRWLGIPGVKKQQPTKRHRPAIWENMLGSVLAMNDQYEQKYFDYDYEGAREFAGVDQKQDLRVSKYRPGNYRPRWETGSDSYNPKGPRKGKTVLWVEEG